MTNKLTPEEIKKALECCVGFSPKCNDCPANRYEAGECSDIVNVQAISVMNSQQAEVERLEKELSTATNHITRLENQIERLLPMLKTKRAEAIKEFAERLNEKLAYYEDEYGLDYGFMIDTVAGDVFNLVKEMVGDDK